MDQLLESAGFKWCLTWLLIFAQLAGLEVDTVAGQKNVRFIYEPIIHTESGLLFSDTDEIAKELGVSISNYSAFTCLGDMEAMELLMGSTSGNGNLSGRCLYNTPVSLLTLSPCGKAVTTFSTMLSLQLSIPIDNNSEAQRVAQGVAFIITNDSTAVGEAAGYLGWLSSAINGQPGHNFAVEIDFFRDAEFNDPAGIHVGVNVNNMTSLITAEPVDLVNSVSSNYHSTEVDVQEDMQDFISSINFITIWIEYHGMARQLDVTIGSEGPHRSIIADTKPTEPLISIPLDLTDVFQESMFVGFSSSSVVSSYEMPYSVWSWTFNSDGPPPDLKRNSNGTKIVWVSGMSTKTRNLIIGITLPSVTILIFLVSVITVLQRRNTRLNALAKKYHELEELQQLGKAAVNFKYQALSAATKGFSSKHLLGSGGFGSVYKGSLRLRKSSTSTDVAVKKISSTSQQGASEFVAEVKVIGQVQHRNLVRLLGWCHEKDDLLLVYECMPNGSLDQHLYRMEENGENFGVLTWARRLKIVSGVAMALSYLHEEWEQRVIHRDVKSSNVMLDINFNARLGDFGLARLSAHGQAPPSTAVLAGTRGYLAPELGHTLRFTEKTDVYSFGALVLEVATGKRPILCNDQQKSSGVILLMDWVWSLYGNGRILEAADVRLENAWDSGEMTTLLKIGLLCCHPNPDERPSMREVLSIWKGGTPFPSLPETKPVPSFGFSVLTLVDEDDSNTDSMFSTLNRAHGQYSPFKPQVMSERSTSFDFSVRFLTPELRSRQWRSTPLPT